MVVLPVCYFFGYMEERYFSIIGVHHESCLVPFWILLRQIAHLVTIKKGLKYHGGLVLFGQIQRDRLVKAKKERMMILK